MESTLSPTSAAAQELLEAFRRGPTDFKCVAGRFSLERGPVRADAGEQERRELLWELVDTLLRAESPETPLGLLEHLAAPSQEDVWGGGWISIQ